MERQYMWGNDSVSLAFEVNADEHVSLSRIVFGMVEKVFAQRLPLAEIILSGTGHWIACDRLIHTTIGRDLVLLSFDERTKGESRCLDVKMRDEQHTLDVVVTYVISPGTSVVCTYATVINRGAGHVFLESVTSAVLPMGSMSNDETWKKEWILLEGHYDWLGEGRWSYTKCSDLFPVLRQELTNHNPRSEHAVVSTGTWSTGGSVPMAFLESRETGNVWAFQVEHNGAWRWEIGDNTVDGYFALSGPTSVNHSWMKDLGEGESFATVPASFVMGGDMQTTVEEMTKYRRIGRLVDESSAVSQVIFNDYMNTINGDPTTEKLLPLISSAAQVGCEVFVIDCGWYDDSGDWWPSVGEWKPSKTRFPGPRGIGEVIDAIKEAGMVPGLWLEPEVIGIKSPVAQELPDSAFFQRNGQRVVEQERYILDLRDESARRYLDGVVDRLIGDYGVQYFKMDYNVSPGAGTDYHADSVGDGLLGHNRAFLDWVDGLHRRYPKLILENCSSGGMREDFAQTSRFQVQSTSDQQDYRLYPVIAATAPLMVLPEQAASWAYPQAEMDAEQTAFNINTTFLGRFFLSGYINQMEEWQKNIIQQGIQAYREHVQPMIGESVPLWPLGLPSWDSAVVALGVKASQRTIVTVWARNAPETVKEVALFLPHLHGEGVQCRTIFPVGPAFDEWDAKWSEADSSLIVSIPHGMYASRSFELVEKGGETLLS